MSSMKTKAVLVLVLAMVVTACGGSAGEEATTTTSASATTTAAPATTTTTQTSNTQPGGSGGQGGLTQVCLEATQAMSAAMASYGAGFVGAFGGTVDDDSLEAASAQLRAMAEAAPAEIRDDLRVIAEELSKLYAALDEIDYQPGTPPTPEQMAQLEALSEVIDQEAFEEAADSVEAWFDTHCGD